MALKNRNRSVHFLSRTHEWGTPPELFAEKNAIYNFTLDACASRKNAKCARYFTKGQNGFKQSWANERVWMNPPYGREIGHWMRKAFEESKAGALVVCLVPARTDTAWWHDYATKGSVTFIRGRLKFTNTKKVASSAPFPSAVVVFR